MDYMFPLLLTVHVMVGLGIIGLVLLQHGKGADMGAAFGSGASGSLFGATGSANFLSRTTAIMAAVFFLTSLGLSYVASDRPESPSSRVLDAAKSQPGETAPAPAAPGQESAPQKGGALEDIPK